MGQRRRTGAPGGGAKDRIAPHFPSPVSCFLILFAAALVGSGAPIRAQESRFQGALLAPEQATAERIGALKRDGWSAIVLTLEDAAGRSTIRAAAERVRQAGLELDYWVEVGRCPTLADRHPEWMASLQGHPEWRRTFPRVPQPGEGEVIKNYPWVPILYRETFDPQFQRVRDLGRDLPKPRRLFVNDLQGAPAACGCGNRLCRWTTDYGQVLTATPLGPEAAALFVRALKSVYDDVEITPVWATECEEHERPTECGGVACFGGACWNLFTQQLMPLVDEAPRVGVLLPCKLFGKDQPRFGPTAGWVKEALGLFQRMPPRRKGRAVPANRLIAVLQGWDTTAEEQQAQRVHSREAGSAGELMAFTPIRQDWEPRVFKIPPGVRVQAAAVSRRGGPAAGECACAGVAPRVAVGGAGAGRAAVGPARGRPRAARYEPPIPGPPASRRPPPGRRNPGTREPVAGGTPALPGRATGRPYPTPDVPQDWMLGGYEDQGSLADPRALLAADLRKFDPLRLAGSAPADLFSYRQALPGYRFQFPRDHASHPQFQTEWWYYTGHLESGGQRFGYELTFFQVGINPLRRASPSRWALHTVYFAHLALTEKDRNRFRYAEKASRAALGLAGAGTDTYHVWLDDWSAHLLGDGKTHRLRARSAEFGIELDLTPGKPPVVHGKGGVSRKAAGPGRASHYYSLTRLNTRGTLFVGSEQRAVTGLSWMDHEFGSNQLSAEQVGWDWFSLQLENGREWMLYSLRRKDRSIEPVSSGTVVRADGSSRHLPLAEFRIEPSGAWKSPRTGATYPAGWVLRVPSEQMELRLTPLVADQELRTRGMGGVTYWEGCVRVEGRDAGKPVRGEGYVELTGYTGPRPAI